MKVLWITNSPFPIVCDELGFNSIPTIGWQASAAISLVNTIPDILLAVAAPYNGNDLKTVVLNEITYYLLPQLRSNHHNSFKLESYWKNIHHQFLPDLVHIHGTEYPFLASYTNVFGNKNVVVSIQGLVSIYARYYFGGIEKKVLRKNITLRDLFKRDTIFSQHKEFIKRGHSEKVLIQSTNHIIGRTSWDKAHTWSINDQTNYHFCNETLRNEFYMYTWELSSCEKHSIFLSQAHYAIKGLHQMIKALPIILKHFPDTKIYVAGNNFITNRGWRLNGYGKYIQALMKENGVMKKFIFTGILQEKEICKRYLDSHVFVCPSSIENSPNSVGEAQLLGVPCIAAYVGGMEDMIQNEETGLLYRFEEVEMLAAAICRIFSNDQLAEKLSANSRIVASFRHDRKQNAVKLNNIYEMINKSF